MLNKFERFLTIQKNVQNIQRLIYIFLKLHTIT